MFFQSQYTTFLQSHQAYRVSFFVLVLWIVWSNTLFCAGERFGRGVRALGMGNAYCAVADDEWAVYYNPAGLRNLSSLQCGVFVVPNQFGLEELRTVSCAIAFPLPIVSVGIGIERFGFELYNETEICCGIAIPLVPALSCGVSSTFSRLVIARYGQTSYAVFNVGLFAQVTETMSLAFTAGNVTAARLGTIREKLPQTYSVGAAYQFVTGGILSFEAEKDIRYPFCLKAGIEQRLCDVFTVRCGVTSNPNIFSVGCAVTLSGCSVGYAGYNHAYLGWTNQAGLSLCL